MKLNWKFLWRFKKKGIMFTEHSVPGLVTLNIIDWLYYVPFIAAIINPSVEHEHVILTMLKTTAQFGYIAIRTAF